MNVMLDLARDLSKISFRFIQPNTPFRAPYSLKYSPKNIIVKSLIQLETLIEILNTHFPNNIFSQSEQLKKICRIPKMSTYAIGAIINAAVSQLPQDEAFVNIGVWHGFTLLAGLVDNASKKCIGVDNFSEFGGPKDAFLKLFNTFKSEQHLFYEMDYQQYFSEIHRGAIGIYIYDGHHSYENQLKGLQIAEPFFAEHCIIMIDDTNIKEVHRATMDFMAKSPGRYKILLDQKTYCNAHPTFWNGITIFQKDDASA